MKSATPGRLVGVALFILAVLAPDARADIGPPLDITLLGDPRPAEAGQPYVGTFRVTALAELAVSAFEIVADAGWQTVFLDDPGLVYLLAGQSVDVAFEAVALDPAAAPLTLGYRVNDLPHFYAFHLSAELFAEGDIAQPTREFVRGGGKASADVDGLAGLARSGPVEPAAGTPLAPWYAGATAAPAPDPAKSGRWITVHGSFQYTRPDKVVDAADGFTVHIFADGKVAATTTTDAAGAFSVPVWYEAPNAGQQPDLRLEYVADNANVQVRNPADKVMRWGTGTWTDFAGNDLDAGSRHPASLDHQVYVHGFTVLNRAWRWTLAETGVDWLKVAMRRETSGGPWYEAGKKLIHSMADRMWMEITVVHEVGHHFLQWHAAGVGGPSNYCNNVCEGTTCGHCTWCYEEAEDAWNEGFPTWMGMMLIGTLPGQYGVTANTPVSFENLVMCDTHGPPALDDPLRNEGPFVALLCDIVDANNEDDTLTPATTGWRDRLTLGTGPIWDVVWGDAPLTPQEFLTGFLGNNGSLREDVWETARNNGYEIDTQNPPAPFLFSSTSHTPGVASPDGTVDLYWLTALDDASGFAGFSLVANLNAPVAPDYLLSCGDVNKFTTINLPAGNWYFTIRSQDRAGRWSAGYATYGPIVIMPPASADLTTAALGGWALPLVPHPAADAAGGNVAMPASLIGGASTWWNLAVANGGTAATVGDVRLTLRVDGQEAGWTTIPDAAPLPGHASATFVNRGPVTVGGGRHAFGAWLDGLEAMAEANEYDNHWAWQWLWQPAEVAVGGPQASAAPPLVTGGWENLVGGASGYNADAVRLRTPGYAFHGYSLFADSDADDYDLQLHGPSDDPQAGLDTWLAGSARVGGFLDAVLVHAASARDVLHDAAVVNYSGGASAAVASHVSAEPYLVSSESALTFAQDEMLKLGVLTVEPSQEGLLTLRLEANQDEGALHLLWFGSDLTTGNLDSWSGYARTGDDNLARMDVVADAATQYFFALYRDPQGGRQPREAFLGIAPTLPDVLPYQAAGWYAPLVPHPLDDGTPSDVPAPDQLAAAPAPTWFNAAIVNDSPVAFPPNPCALLIDGAAIGEIAFPALAPGGASGVNLAQPYQVAGGRHTAGLLADAAGGTTEANEANNGWAVQWVWEPVPLVPGQAPAIVYPPDPGSGWESIADPGPAGLGYNCAGFRFGGAPDVRTRAGQWIAVAVMPAAGEDADVELHEASTGPRDGFIAPLALSGWSADEGDFVLVNYNRAAVRPFDAGVLRSSGGGPCDLTAVASTFLGHDPAGQTAVFSLPAVQSLALHEVWLSPGVWIVHLENLDGIVDYGVTMHPGQLSYLAKSNALPGGSSWAAGPGQDEWLAFTVDEARYHCLSVWKRGTADQPLAGSYRLVFETGMSPVRPMVTVERSVLLAAQPNPFNPRVTVGFALSKAGAVDLSVFDLRGRRIRRLATGPLPAGVHQAEWDGTDEQGRRLASGAYLVRLVGPDAVTDQRRVTMIK